MKFEVGKYYQHSGGPSMAILCEAKTTLYGDCLIAEELGGSFRPVSKDEEAAINWKEITKEEWYESWNRNQIR